MLKVKNMVSHRSGREIVNQFIITDSENNIVTFQSYSSPIVTVDCSNLVITVHPAWDYSATTGKYRNQFMDYMGLYGMSCKADFEKAMKIGSYEMFRVVCA